MVKKAILAGVLLLPIVVGSISGGKTSQPDVSTAIADKVSSSKEGYGLYHSIGMIHSGVGVVDTIQYCFNPGDPYTPLDRLDNTTSYDSVWWQFTPLEDGTLMAVQGCFHTPGTAKLYVSRYLSDSCYYLMDDTSLNPNLLPQQLFWNVKGNDSSWQTFDFMSYPQEYHIPVKAGTSYVIGYCTDNQGRPYINWDYYDERYIRPHDWRFTSEHQRVRCGDEGWDCLCDTPPAERSAWYYISYQTTPPRYPEIMMRAIVLYIPRPQNCCEVDQLPDTYQTNLNSIVTARIRIFSGQILARAELYWKVRNSSTVDSTEMEVASERGNYYSAKGKITGNYSVGDTIDYWCQFREENGS